MRLSPGDNLERYQIRGLLGWGGMAEVWEVRHRQLGTRHALKVLINPGDEQRVRLLREGEAQAGLSHPNLLPVSEILDVDGVLGLLMPLVEGPSLARLLEGHRPTHAQAFALIQAVCSGVQAAHAAGLVHRDLKPGNVLLDLSSGAVVPRVSDFGLVKGPDLGARLTGSLGVLGTPAYMSPEQLRRSRDVDARSDLWSLGVMLCELLTGALPFRADSIPALIEAHQQPPALGALSGELSGVLRALLQVDPRARLASCETLLRCLDALEPAPARDPLGADAPLAAIACGLQAPRPTASAVPTLHNLPSRRDGFIGREAELRSLRRAFASGARLVTVTGEGGVGKTRLAVEFSEAAASRWPDGVWLCDLAEARTEAALVQAVADALGLQGPLTSAALGEALAARGEVLLVLDTFEQVTHLASDTLGVWLEAAPSVSVLATSRQPLAVPDEVCLALDALAEIDALALFVQRMTSVRPDFVLTDQNQSQLIALVSELGGLPLTIELAAARARRLSPSRLLARLADRFTLLRSDASDRPPRQRSLHANLSWTWSLLTDAERDLLRRCAEHTDITAAALSSTEDALNALAEKHLLSRTGSRYRMSQNLSAFIRLPN